MRSLKRQRGITFWGLAFVAVVLGFCLFIALKMFPVIYESFRIDSALNGLVQDDLNNMTKHEIQNALIRRFEVNEVRRISQLNMKDHLAVEKTPKTTKVTVTYSEKVPLFWNISIVADYEKERVQ